MCEAEWEREVFCRHPIRRVLSGKAGLAEQALLVNEYIGAIQAASGTH
jgi:hypothetical protein